MTTCGPRTNFHLYLRYEYLHFRDKTCTGKYLSEALIFASTNPQYDYRLFIELKVQYMKIPSSKHGENIIDVYRN